MSLQAEYQSLLLMAGIKQPVLFTQDFTEQSDVLNEVFNFASIQLALMRFPRVFFPEILGFTLAFFHMPTLLEVCFSDHQLNTVFFMQRKNQLEMQVDALLNCISSYLATFPQYNKELWLRIQHGFFLYQQQMQCCRDQFHYRLENQQSIEQMMADVFQQKAVAAIGHHHKICIDGISLDQWFSEMPDKSGAFLKALKKSKYIDTARPENSQLLKLFDFKGPMLGVLNKNERELLIRWIKSENNISIVLQSDTQAVLSNTILPEVPLTSSNKYQKLSHRELYYYLLNADLFPDVLLTAKNKTKQWLGACNFFCRVPFKKYSHQQFDRYISNIYHREMKAYQPLLGQPKISKTAYLWALEQLAPMILIDGCWLQNSLEIERINPGISEILFGIYADEIGNGIIEQSHPYIFQQLLDSLSISVPAVYSQNFIQHEKFINSAFDLPVYMLALSHFPVQFLPELLGLNMAIELSGLGKNYMKLVDDWNYWGIDPSIASIHISIDNYASGHTFLAKKAIKLYLDQIKKNTANSSIVDQHWRRICCGYSSLVFVSTRFKLAMPTLYLINKYVVHKP
jgi:hypothetical protein